MQVARQSEESIRAYRILHEGSAMSTSVARGAQRGRPVVLQATQVLTLSKPANGISMKINIQAGILRISSTATEKSEEITLAMTSKYEQGCFQHPQGFHLQVEAVSEASFWIDYEQPGLGQEKDFLSDWILQLHWVRHPIKTEERLMRFFELMCQRLGKRAVDGYLLEFLLPHARIAEIIGATRSTVSRSIGSLKRSQIIEIDEIKKQLLIPIQTK